MPTHVRLLLAALMLVLSGLSCSARRTHVKQNFYRMDTALQATVVLRANDPRIPAIWRSVDSLLAVWETRFSQTNPKSEVLAVNQRSRPCVPVSAEFAAMVAAGQRYADTTKGMFDFTILPVKELWGLGETDTAHAVPSTESLRDALSCVDHHAVGLSAHGDSLCFLRACTRIDVGGLAKGFALRALAELLDGYGIANYLIASGDVMCRGHRADGRPWIIGIQHPRRPDELLATMDLDSGVIFTSGDYERFWIAPDGSRVHHIFDPHTGRSCTRNQSLTIWSPDYVQAKVLSTGLFGWPSDSIVAFVSGRNMGCVVVDSAGHVVVGGTFVGRVRMTSDEPRE